MDQCLTALDGSTALTFFSEKKGVVYSTASSSTPLSCGLYLDVCTGTKYIQPCCPQFKCHVKVFGLGYCK